MKSASVYDNIKNLKAFDASGNEIAAEIDSATGTMHFASAPYKVTYDYDTGFNSVMMDVTAYADEYDDPSGSGDSDTPVSGSVGSSGGCNADFGMTAMFAVLFMLLKKRH